MNLKKVGNAFTSKFVGTGPSSYKKRIYRAAVAQRLRNTGLVDLHKTHTSGAEGRTEAGLHFYLSVLLRVSLLVTS